MMRRLALTLLIFAGAALARRIQLTMRENLTQPCPGVRSNTVDTKSVHVDFQFVGGPSDGDEVTVINGNDVRTVRFPGCYDVSVSFALQKPLKTPYVEAFLQLGTNLPCKTEAHTHSPGASADICSNITNSNWCPQSRNPLLRQMLNGRSTCQFCNVCESARQDSDVKRFIQTESRCEGHKGRQQVSLRMCTPSRQEIREREGDEKLEAYWEYLKQGVLTTVIHVLDRSGPQSSRCQQMCSTYKSRKVSNKNYQKTLLQSIEKVCAPEDTYAACIFHTQKFDVNSDF